MRFFLFLSVVVLTSCNKEPVSTAATSLIGNWQSADKEGVGQKIEIFSNGNGFIKTVTNGVENTSTKERTWYISDNELHFGKAAFSGQFYEITQYPETASMNISFGNDSVIVGQRYVILDDKYFKEVE